MFKLAYKSSIYLIQIKRMQSLVPSSITRKSNYVLINVQAKPNARQNSITDINDEYIGICVAAPPREGEANAELCEYLAGLIPGLKKRQVQVKPGTQKSRHKIIEIETELSVEEIYNFLRNSQ